MWNRIFVAVIGVPILILVLLVFPVILTPVMVAVLSVMSTREIVRAIGIQQIRIRYYTMILSGCIPFWVYFGEPPLSALWGLLLYVALIFAEALPSHYQVKMELVGGGAFFAILISYLLSALVRIELLSHREIYILIPVAVSFLSDAFAMFSGMCFGKHKLAPELSPKKTVEGSLGGFVGAVLCLMLYGFLIHVLTGAVTNYFYLAIYGVLGSAVAQFGDLSFSYMKRQCGIKDFGTFFQSHGGVLDRFDSVIFCAPFIELLIMYLPAFKL